MEEKKTFRDKVGDFKTTCKAKWLELSCWAERNKEILIVAVPIVVSGTIEMTKVVMKYQATHEEKELKERYIYDRSAGHYYETRRQPKSNEWREIDYRHNVLHQPLGEVLADMRLLK